MRPARGRETAPPAPESLGDQANAVLTLSVHGAAGAWRGARGGDDNEAQRAGNALVMAQRAVLDGEMGGVEGRADVRRLGWWSGREERRGPVRGWAREARAGGRMVGAAPHEVATGTRSITLTV